LHSLAASTNVDSQPIFLEPFNGFSDATEDPSQRSGISYPKLDLPPSDTGSAHSGRQFDHGSNFGDRSSNKPEDSDASKNKVTGTSFRHGSDNDHGTTPQKDPTRRKRSPSELSDDSFPSMTKVWVTASANSSQSPVNQAAKSSSMKASKRRFVFDSGDEDSTRRSDESESFEDGDDGPQRRLSKLAHKLVDKPIEKPSPKEKASLRRDTRPPSSAPIKTERASPTPATRVSKPTRPNKSYSARSTESAFEIPEGSQVVSLLTSSPEPEAEEHYAEDSIDETYEEPGMPSGSGWVRKSRVRRRGSSVPAPNAAQESPPKRFASSQKPAVTGNGEKRTSAVLSSLLRAEKRTLNMW
jgi:hypothetical protein